MGVIETKVFKSGNSVAVRLPRELGLAAGVAVTIEKVGDTLKIKPVLDAAEEKRKVRELVDALLALPSVSKVEKRIAPEAPIRRGI